MKRAWPVLLLTGCSFLAQSDVFAWMRPELIKECCTCLAQNSSDDFASSCTPASVSDGVVVPVEPGTPPVPCICNADDNDYSTCVDRLSAPPPDDRGGAANDELLVNGSCITEGTGPCTSACTGVLSFAPLPEA
jgi:hypothetical protein